MASVTITVNGQSVEKYLGMPHLPEEEEQLSEVQKFLRQEHKSFRYATQRHQISHSTKNVSKPVDAGNGRIEFK